MCAFRLPTVISYIDAQSSPAASHTTSSIPTYAKVAKHRCSVISAGSEGEIQQEREISVFSKRKAATKVQFGVMSKSLPREAIMANLRHAASAELAEVQIHGTVLLQRKNELVFNSPVADIGDALSELIGQNVKMTLVSTHKNEGAKEGRRSETTDLAGWLLQPPGLLTTDEGSSFQVVFSVDTDFGMPGALLVESHHPNEFFLKSVTLKMPDSTNIHFVCNSWINNTSNYRGPRIFFANKVYLPSQTPQGIQSLRLEELANLQGESDPTGERKAADRVYDYDVYNDLGNPDENEDLARPILGGSKEYPYPRRCRTGRKHTETDPSAESPTSLLQDAYVPRDEQFGLTKELGTLGISIKSFAHYIVPILEHLFQNGTNFTSFREIGDLYTQGLDLSNREKPSTGKESDPSLLKYPLPAIIHDNKQGVPSDEEFARETLAGMNPLVIERLKVFPPVGNLDPKLYGPQTSAITHQHIESSLEGLTIEQALDAKRLFIVDYHDFYLPYLHRINALQGKGYASRSLFFLSTEEVGTLKPLCIELSLPPPTPGSLSIRRVFTRDSSVEWDLAKTHAIINDAGYHELVSHWLRTHASIEPFIIALHRQISVLHPLYVLLIPHCKYTLNANALARKTLVNSGGVMEKSLTPTKYSMEMSSTAYMSWRFDEQGLPADLIKRGIAEMDPSSENGLKLFVEDYPFAVDGLQIWSAIQDWVSDYLSHYYKDDTAVRDDAELQSWWAEIREVGHGDKRDESWWAAMQTVKELHEVMVTLIWLASAHHAAVNYGQYAYAGYMPNKPTMGRKLIPDLGTSEYEQMQTDPTKFYLEMVSSKAQATIFMTTLEILSQHPSDEEYLGQRDTPNWTSDEAILAAFSRFRQKLAKIEQQIIAKNENPRLKNRVGGVRVPYTFLLPTSEEGLTGRGVPNSIVI